MSDSDITTCASKSNTFLSGAAWVRVDFHLHTKVDREFKYSGEPNQFVAAYVEALENAGIRLGVVTNHNKFDYEEFKVLRSAAQKRQIGLLPGVELSVNDGANGIHTLIVFSDQWLEKGQDHINPFLTVAFEGKTPSQYENENGRSSLSLLDTIKKLEGYHRDFFLVFAHVEQNSGLWRELDGGRMQELGGNELFRRRTRGFQKVRTHDGAGNKDRPCRTRVQSWLDPWYPAELEGSDPKSIDEIGKGSACYLKLGELSFEAVKFSLSDPQCHVAAAPPKRTASHICSIHFDGGILDGQTLHLSPELNTFIGIRGSGKSSVLEAIRYVLDIPRGDKSLDVAYKDGLIKHTLGSGGKVTLVAEDTYGQHFTISRIFRENSNVYLAGKLQPGVSIRETILRKPIYFGQKDLSSTGDGFETDLVEKLVGEKLRQLRGEIEDQRQRVRDAVIRLQQLSAAAEQKREYEAQLADAQFRLQKFTDYGIDEKLKKRLGYLQDAAALARIREQADHFIAGLSRFLAEYEDEVRNANSYTSKENAAFFESYYNRYSFLVAKLDAVKQIEFDSRTIAAELDAKKLEFDRSLSALQEEFAQIERQLAEELKQTGAPAIQPDDFLQQQQRKSKAEQMLSALRKQESQREVVHHALLVEMDRLNNLWLREYKTITDELDHVNANHSALQISSEFKGDKAAAIDFMQQMFRGSNIRLSTLETAMAPYSDFGGMFWDWENAKINFGSTPDVFASTFQQNLADFLTWQVPNTFVIRYRGKELKHHSLGQRASALILYVLSQRQNDVMIIDQPEDDLDNQTIYDDVIKLIRQLKPQTQFIFATHNANFPVLGDAEQVHACHFQDDTVTVESGSVDARAIQEAIINIMEGGEEAFNKRKEVYNLWKPPTSSK